MRIFCFVQFTFAVLLLCCCFAEAALRQLPSSCGSGRAAWKCTASGTSPAFGRPFWRQGSSLVLRWLAAVQDSWGRTTQPSAGYAGLSFCCFGSRHVAETPFGGRVERRTAHWRCHFAKLSIPSDCCPLPGWSFWECQHDPGATAARLGESQCGWGPSAVCSAPLNLTLG